MNCLKLSFLIMVVFFGCSNTQAKTVNSFNPHYLDLLKYAEDDPRKALDQLQAIDVSDFSPIQLAEIYYFESIIYGYLEYPNKMLEKAEAGLQQINKTDQPWLYHHLILEKVHAWDRKGKGLKGFGDAENALHWAQNQNEVQLQLNAMYVLSSLYIQIEDYHKALAVIQKAYDMAPEDGPLFVKADFSSQLSSVYIYRNEFEIALPYLEETYQHQKNKNNKLGISIALYELGRANLILDHPEKGLDFLTRSIKLSRELGDLQGVAYANNEIASHYIKTKEFGKASDLLLKSVEIFNQSENVYLLFDTHLQLSNLYTEVNELELAKNHLEQARPLIDPINFPYNEIAIKRQEAKILAAEGESDKAYELLLETIKDQRELEAKQSSEKLHQIRALYEIEANNRKNELLTNKNLLQQQELDKKKQQNIWLLSLLIAAVLFIMMIIFFLMKFKIQSAKLHNLANYDELTGLRNRFNTIMSIRERMDTLLPYDQLFLVMVDLDHFKSINDQFGHALGDKVLSTFGDYCNELFKKNDIIGRIGGEEFLICLTNYDKDYVLQLLENLRIKTSQMHKTIKAPGLSVTISAGVCMTDSKNKTFHQMLKCTDKAMYKAKHAGRNQIVFN